MKYIKLIKYLSNVFLIDSIKYINIIYKFKMFGNINKTNKNDTSRRNISENSLPSKGRNNIYIKPNRYDETKYLNRSSRYDETTYSVSSEEESDESQKSVKKSFKNNKTPRIENIELIKKENIELKLKNEYLTELKLTNEYLFKLSESILKTSNMMIDIFNEQKLINSRLDEIDSNYKQSVIRHNLDDLKNKNIIMNKNLDDLKNLDNDILPIGDDSSHGVSENNKSLVVDTLNKPITLPKILEKK
jgi:hypothetical protein